jgi:hypothetical protein
VKFLRFWSKKKTFNFCGFFFLRIENLGTERKIACIIGINNWSAWQWSLWSYVSLCILLSHTVPDLPLCLGVLKDRAPLARGSIFLPNKKIYVEFCLCGTILNLKAFCFGVIPDIMIELIVYESVPQSKQSWQA